MTRNNDRSLWDQAQQASATLDLYIPHRVYGEMEKITGQRKIWQRNTQANVSIWTAIAVLNEKFEKRDGPDSAVQESVNDLQDKIKELENEIEELRQYQPTTKKERIIADLAQTDDKQREIADRYDVSEQYVSALKKEELVDR